MKISFLGFFTLFYCISSCCNSENFRASFNIYSKSGKLKDYFEILFAATIAHTSSINAEDILKEECKRRFESKLGYFKSYFVGAKTHDFILQEIQWTAESSELNLGSVNLRTGRYHNGTEKVLAYANLPTFHGKQPAEKAYVRNGVLSTEPNP